MAQLFTKPVDFLGNRTHGTRCCFYSARIYRVAATSYTRKITPYRHPVLIYNPTAGKFRRNPERILPKVAHGLAQIGIEPRLAPTSGPGDATNLAREAVASGADLILVLGGDGTINEVLNGMVPSAVPLAILPAGTANVLSMEIGLGSRLSRAIAHLGQCVERRIAVGLLAAAGGSRYFLAMGGAGLDARIVYDLSPELKARAGKMAYWLGGFGHITQTVESFEARVNGTTLRCGFVLASRVRNYGGDLEIARGASLLRPEFEVVLFEGSNPLRYLAYMCGVGLKCAHKMPGVHTIHAPSVELKGGVHVQIDGEYAGRLPVRFEIVPDALTLLMPPAYG
jgi:diacylglycerol kinase (ATP)